MDFNNVSEESLTASEESLNNLPKELFVKKKVWDRHGLKEAPFERYGEDELREMLEEIIAFEPPFKKLNETRLIGEEHFAVPKTFSVEQLSDGDIHFFFIEWE